MATIMLDAGHGGADPGATYLERMEKDDALRLTLAIGELLQQSGINVIYTRTEDVYETPARKAAEGNASDADYFISIHRNSSPNANQYTGVESLVYDSYGPARQMAENINRQLERTGFANQGIHEQKNLTILNKTQMPAILVEIGFVNTERDNLLFDSRFSEIAQAVADGIAMSI
ncbi:MAG: N-acetylmuramoyl-L-alanine amidase [Lachnospiraceae bacterium]|nr:N-acetylmuramoyl-L-alanine amidase [Lachnospiraceae bacterium]MDE6185925.1 N-acetylmuramoyl-L-alanine amidase [Lachnospiraceae bacterium]